MLVKTKGSALHGIDAITITIEVNVSMGQGYCVVGLPDSAVKESLHRTESAIKSNGFHMPRTKVVINLSPADLRKTGAAFDLPIAIGVLAASEQLNATTPIESYIMMGELGLDGTLYPIKGVLAMAIQAKEEGYVGIIIPMQNASEANMVKALPVFGFENIIQVIDFFRTPEHYPHYNVSANKNMLLGMTTSKIQRSTTTFNQNNKPSFPLFSDVKGQDYAKRALEIASAGNHNMMMIGPPGAGKSMLAKSIVSILPPLSPEEALETSKIYSIAGKLNTKSNLIQERPFRQPHHSVSAIALIGGGSIPHPGEISLAHNGVLFLDELPEFNRSTIEVLRQPMEEGSVSIARAKMTLHFPARFMLIAAMNPCPCGYYNHPQKSCLCSPNAIQKYMHKISGPLLDRIDLHIEVVPVAYEALRISTSNDLIHPHNSISNTLGNVEKVRSIQLIRFQKEPGIYTNTQMQSSHIKQFCIISSKGEALLKSAMEKFQLSARAFDRILKVSRTIADLADSKTIELNHISEAIQYRTFDRSNWGQYKC